MCTNVTVYSICAVVVLVNNGLIAKSANVLDSKL